jgi:adenosylhomocysteine nucleosidase
MIVVIVALETELSRHPLIDDVVLIHSGVGKINATLAARLAIEQHRPSLVINYGTAGAIHASAIGLMEVARVIQRDMIAEPIAPRGVTPFSALSAEIESGHTGVCCATGDSFVTAADPWLQDHKVDVVDMELYAIADVCRRSGLPWRAFKFVTDMADAGAADAWSRQVGRGELLFEQALHRLVIQQRAAH